MTYNTADVRIIAEQLRWAKDKGYSTAVLVGAGMSVSAGIPAAGGVIEEVRRQFPYLADTCQKETYAAYMSLLAPAQRRQLIGSFVDNARINLAHLYLGTLVRAEYVDHVLTTNFDALVVRSLGLFNIHPAVYDFAASQDFIPGEAAQLSVFHLHGQRDGFVLLNTEDEVNKHSAKLKNVFQDARRRRCWIVIGYSGESDPVFERLAETDAFQNKLFWVGHKDEEPKKHVLERILQPSTKFGYFVKGYDADKFFLDLAKELDLPDPQIISRPFTHLLEQIDTIAEFSVDDRLADVTRETRKWISSAVEGFEEGMGFEAIQGARKTAIGADEMVRAARNVWVHSRFGEIDGLLAAVRSSGTSEAIQYLAFALNNWGNALSDLARMKEGEEAETLFRDSFQKYDRALEMKPDMHEALNNWGTALSGLANMKEGEEAETLFRDSFQKYDRALEIKPDKHEALYNWGNALSNLAKMKEGEEAEALFEEALEKYERAVEMKPDLHEALNNWGAALSDLAKMKEGEEAEALFRESFEKYERAVEIKPDNHDALNNWGNALSDLAKMKEGEEAEALFRESFEKYERAVEIKADKHEALNNWGTALSHLAKMKEGEEAEGLFEESLEKLIKGEDIKPGASAYNIACAYSLKGETANALTWLEKALTMKSSPTRSHILADSDLDNIRSTEEFTRLMDTYRPVP